MSPGLLTATEMMPLPVSRESADYKPGRPDCRSTVYFAGSGVRGGGGECRTGWGKGLLVVGLAVNILISEVCCSFLIPDTIADFVER